MLRFNFRGVGGVRGRSTKAKGEMDDFRAALDYMARGIRRALWAAGFSFGAWVALETGATDDRVQRSSVSRLRSPHRSLACVRFPNTLASPKPKFFVQGEADEVCPLEGMWAFYGKLHEPKELVVIDAANHLFEGKTPEVGEALEDLLADFEG